MGLEATQNVFYAFNERRKHALLGIPSLSDKIVFRQPTVALFGEDVSKSIPFTGLRSVKHSPLKSFDVKLIYALMFQLRLVSCPLQTIFL